MFLKGTIESGQILKLIASGLIDFYQRTD